MKNLYYGLIFLLFLISCEIWKTETSEVYDKLTHSGLSETELQDKILGMLVGSAIGDAMRAPTEMWSRKKIKLSYGFDQLPKAEREQVLRVNREILGIDLESLSAKLAAHMLKK